MKINRKQLFVFIGDDRTGKTTIQKLILEKLCGHGYERLPVNVVFPIIHPNVRRKFETASFGNRSYQEKSEYGSVSNYFTNHFKDADIAFISSHLIVDDIRQMITEGQRRYFNVVGVFWSNSIAVQPQPNAEIAALDWNSRIILENHWTDSNTIIDRQLETLASNLVLDITNLN